jgi:hypothetical protein
MRFLKPRGCTSIPTLTSFGSDTTSCYYN